MVGTISKRGKAAFRRVLLRFFVLFISFGVIAGGLSFLLYAYQSKSFTEELLARERNGVELRKEIVEDVLDSVVADLDYLSSKNGVREFVASGDRSGFPQLSKDLLSFASAEGLYDQIRLFGPDGMELVRVNHNSGLPEVVDESLLQNKGKRYYYQDTMSLGPRDIYVSPMDLNIEMGEVEVPYKPVIRFGRPLFAGNGDPRGALVLNYYADKLLGELRKTRAVTTGQTMLLNNRGYWLLAPDSKDQWGFMFPNRKDVSFPNRYPQQWKEISEQESGQVMVDGMVFTYATIYPLNFKFKSSSGSDKAYEPSETIVRGNEYSWKLVSFVPSTASMVFSLEVILTLFLWGGGLFVLAGSFSWGISLLIVSRPLRLALMEQGPGHDPVTGVPGVGLFYERLEKTVEMAIADGGGFNLMSVGVRDYKMVVNTYGFDVADDIMKQIAERLESVTRQVDSTARVSESEFIVIVMGREVDSSYISLVQSVESAMMEPFSLGLDGVELSVDVGMSRYPDDSTDMDILVALSRSSI